MFRLVVIECSAAARELGEELVGLGLRQLAGRICYYGHSLLMTAWVKISGECLCLEHVDESWPIHPCGVNCIVDVIRVVLVKRGLQIPSWCDPFVDDHHYPDVQSLLVDRV